MSTDIISEMIYKHDNIQDANQPVEILEPDKRRKYRLDQLRVGEKIVYQNPPATRKAASQYGKRSGKKFACKTQNGKTTVKRIS